MAVPEFDGIGNLPVDIYPATMAEIADRFGYTPARRVLLDGLRHAINLLADIGCRQAWLDGSFVTASERAIGRAPTDYDLCWDIAGVDFDRLTARESALDPLRPDRAAIRQRYGGDLFFVIAPLGIGLLETFQYDRDGRRKGLVLLDPQAEGGQR